MDEELGPEFERRILELDEVRLSYLVRFGSGSPLLLIPGSFDDSRACKAIIDGLEDERRVAVVELRGHGESWPPPENGSIEQFAQDVLCIAEQLDFGNFFIGGHSIGGMVALEVARICPELVRGVLAIEGMDQLPCAGHGFRWGYSEYPFAEAFG